MGDPYQLQAIEAGAAFRAISERSPTVALTDIRRQQLAWQRHATVELATGKTAAAIARYASHDHVHAFETQAVAKQGLVELWNDVRLNQPDKTQIMLAYTRQDVEELNQLARSLRQKQGELGADHVLATERGKRTFADGDRIYFLKNDRELGVKNGTLGTIQRIQSNLLVVQLDKNDNPAEKARTITFSTDRYNNLDHGYAATIHKSQGVTVDRAYLLASKYMDGHAAYVGLSRHRESADVFYGRDEFANERALSQSLGRERSKDITLDYGHDFAQQRGFEKAMQATELKLEPSLSTPQQSLERRPEHYEQFMQQAAKQYNLLEKQQKMQARGDFKDFKAQFEAQNPERAKALQEAVQPRHERLALEAEKHINLLEKALEQSRMPRSARQQLESYAASVAKQPNVMAYLKQHNPDMTKKIEMLAKSHTLNRDRDIGGRSL